MLCAPLWQAYSASLNSPTPHTDCSTSRRSTRMKFRRQSRHRSSADQPSISNGFELTQKKPKDDSDSPSQIALRFGERTCAQKRTELGFSVGATNDLGSKSLAWCFGIFFLDFPADQVRIIATNCARNATGRSTRIDVRPDISAIDGLWVLSCRKVHS